ncbi:MAG: hypothetical protein UT01_C0038G0004 [Candidatus Daviesbacteria bacterium GW2011_GWA1_38_7]|nr:MAG: hypothetical protein UT01_C0038G0004 [Candidatus Daviesbacteria bacterium GW2011_GWA1_38_7]
MGKHDPPYPIPAFKKCGFILLSNPIPLAMSVISAPTFSDKLAILFINDILVAKNALEAYLISSELLRSVTTNGHLSFSYIFWTNCAAFLFLEPITMRSVFAKSSIADPSFKNSGLETTSNSPLNLVLIMFSTRSLVPTGTVLLITITL